MADDEYSPEQKAKIARHFVFATPHGEVSDIVKDLKKVVKPSTIIDDSWVKATMGAYHKKKFSIISGDTSKVIACPQAERKENIYFHPDKKIVCHVDPVTQVPCPSECECPISDEIPFDRKSRTRRTLPI